MIDSIRDGDEAVDRTISRDGSYKLDLYSVPVFLLEVIVLGGLAYSAYYIHFQHKHEPLISGIYCDDTAYRQQFVDSDLTDIFRQTERELWLIALLLTLPIVLIIFCELVNSMFGALSFRQIRALCKCCKLHSITRRTLRFSAAYLLGFLIVMISCDILANSTGRLKPYFAQDCPNAYSQCPRLSGLQRLPEAELVLPGQPTASPQQLTTTTTTLMPSTNKEARSLLGGNISSQAIPAPSSSPISSPSGISVLPQSGRIKRSIANEAITSALTSAPLLERTWISFERQSLLDICPKVKEAEEVYPSTSRDRLQQIAMSWPSFPAAIVTYAILFTCCYLSFVGTARPVRLITCVLVMVLLLCSVIFNVRLIREHYNHWEDVVSAVILSFIVVAFVLYVYLNKFRDTHYYENQKLIKPKRTIRIHENFRGYSNDGAIGEFNNLDKIDHIDANGSTNDIRSSSLQNGDVVGGSGNDVAMRYFQIPRANYRGAPRPLSSLNQML